MSPTRSLILSENEFLPILEREAQPFFSAISAVNSFKEAPCDERAFFSLSVSAKELANFLEIHGALNNKRFGLLHGYCEEICWLSKALSCLVFVVERKRAYPPFNKEWSLVELPRHAEAATACVKEVLDQAINRFCEAWKKSGLSAPELPQGAMAKIYPPQPRLPADAFFQEPEVSSPEFLEMAKYLSKLKRFFTDWDKKTTLRMNVGQDPSRWMKKYCTEAIARSFESRAHTLQNEYDTNLRGTSEEEFYQELPKVRGAVGQCFHLLESVTSLTHLYEKHYSNFEKNFEGRETLLTVLVNNILGPAYKSLELVMPLVDELLGKTTQTSSIDLEVPENIQLHARPLSLIASIVRHYGLDIRMSNGTKLANAASFMEMLILVGSNPKLKKYTFSGDGRCLADIAKLFELGLGEKDLESVRSALPYLK